ncbi:unnamed protein product [Danaus chrysippus]|uniref:(African queen) hypothetical protein n=1 Tax=Danaus chrysippus TaxID=151541 RepID=A0A8J2QXF8_9NEOP|nr:unnamed protein product [Danaus chrysippus]
MKMDIRNFFAKKRKITSTEDDDASCSKQLQQSSEVDSAPITQSYSANKKLCNSLVSPQDSEPKTINSCSIVNEVVSESRASTSTSILDDGGNFHENYIGRWVGRSFVLTTEKRMEMLKRCWVPSETYDFAGDATHLKRKFNHSWLEMYKPWLVYSKKLKGAFCLFCVLFPPKVARGVQGSLIVRPFTKYKDIHIYCKAHVDTQWHRESSASANSFSNIKTNVQVALQIGREKIIDDNRNALLPIISTIVFCGTHDLPLRGKEKDDGVFQDLLQLKIKSGDEILRQHLEKGQKNAQYTSPKIQNEILNICGILIREKLVDNIRVASAFSILADESADISGKEQLAIGLRYYDQKEKNVKEEFMGFVELEKMDAQTIAAEINRFINTLNIDANKCVGQGYDGCATMAGKDGGVQKILRETYKKGLYFHCACHRLNLVVNDLNNVSEIRNYIGTVKDTINFFRESVLRQRYAPKIPLLCETRWSHKYQSISMFKKYFAQIAEGLEKLSREGNSATRKVAFQLLSAVSQTTFIFALCIIDKYNSMLQPVANILQSKTLDILRCAEHIETITTAVAEHRRSAEEGSEDLIKSAEKIATALNIDLRLPRTASRQQHRANQPAASLSEYFRRSLYVPYLDSLSSSLEARFSRQHSPAFTLSLLHPTQIIKITVPKLQKCMEEVSDFYE